jgi:uracil-DNA glycosylase
MGGDERQLNPAEAASLLGWWVEAGVDVSVADQPRNWLKKSVPTAAVQADPASVAPALREKAATLEAFHAWLRETADLPLFQAGANRALPHGPAQASIMLVSDLPDREHAGEGRPIGAEVWELTVRMLAAIGFKPEDAYVASLACFPALGTRLGPEDLRRCAETMREHIGLVAPKRLLLLGDGTARAMLGQSLVQARGRIHRIEQVPAVATFHPRQLLDRPADKAHAWRDLLLLMNEEVS